MTGFSPWASAFDAPVTAKSASEERHAEIAPIGDRAGRNNADQQVAGDAPGICRRERQHQNAEQVQRALDPRQRPAQRKHEGARQIKHKRKLIHDTALRR
jgi:hypothetical protein